MVNPLHRVSLVSRTSGQVIAIYLSDGENVKRGEFYKIKISNIAATRQKNSYFLTTNQIAGFS